MDVKPKKKYKNNYLTQVICQITYDKQSNLFEEQMKAYKRLLGDAYGELSLLRQQGIIIENSGSDIQTHSDDTELWQIQSVDKTHSISITSESLAIVYTKYNKFRDHIDDILSAQNKFIEIFESIEEIKRVGLRYVNQISPKDFSSWGDYIDKRLIDSLDFVDYSKLRRSMHTMNFQHDDEVNINFLYGIFNEYFPANIFKNEFIIDLDAYSENTNAFSDCKELISKFNKTVAIYFEEAITDKLRKTMEVIENA